MHKKHSVSIGPGSHLIEELEDTHEGSEDVCKQMGPKNKTSISRRQADFVQMPITGIFSEIHQVCGLPAEFQGVHHSAAVFFTLQLDIPSDKIRTVQDALESLVARESVQGYTTKTKQEVWSPLAEES